MESTDIARLTLVMGYIAVKDLNSIPEKVKVLDSLRYSNKEMAVICNTSENTIAVTKANNKRQGKRK
ncbi:MAG: hypothetical protein JSU09_12540 [Bacteroidetes bacterium]|nr:hypothetical protein [Bacteroidota bacterium]